MPCSMVLMACKGKQKDSWGGLERKEQVACGFGEYVTWQKCESGSLSEAGHSMMQAGYNPSKCLTGKSG